MRHCKGRYLETTLDQTRDCRKSAQFKFEVLGRHDLACDADIRKARLGAQSKRSRCAMGEQPFISCKPLSCPMPAPNLDHLVVAATCGSTVVVSTVRHHRLT